MSKPNIFEILTSGNLEVFFQNEVELDTGVDVRYIKSGEEEINTFVKNEALVKIENQLSEEMKKSKADLDSYIETNVIPSIKIGEEELFAKIETYANEEIEKNKADLELYVETHIIPSFGEMIGQLSEDLAEVNRSLDLISQYTEEAKEYAQSSGRPGTIVAHPSAVLDGYLLANGAAVSRSTYRDLFAAIGTIYGVGDGASTFNLPDFRGQFLRGYLGGVSNAVGQAQTGGLPNITGSMREVWMSAPPVNFSAGCFTSTYRRSVAAVPSTQPGQFFIELDASKSNALYGAAAEVRPVNQAVYWFVKY